MPFSRCEARVDEEMLRRIEQVRLSERLAREKEEFFQREVEVTADRAVLALEAWQETEGEVLDVRWAKLLQRWAERAPIVIFKDQLLVGNETKLFRGAAVGVEYEAQNMLETMEKGRRMRTSAARVATCADEDWEAVGEAINFFLGKAPADIVLKITESLYGDWPEEFEKARGFYRQGRNHTLLPVPVWEKLFSLGLRGIIQEAKAGIEKVRRGEEPDARKAWFWQGAIIVCEAVIHYARRYSRLARELALGEQPARRAELERVAEVCARVPEYPARTLQEALQSRIIWGLAIKWSRLNLTAESGRVDQYLYPYFMSDIREHRLTLEEAGELIGALLSNVARQEAVKSIQVGQFWPGTLINNVALGGVTKDGQDANNELTYLILHMEGLLRYAEPHYTFRVNAGTPRWALRKALDVNRKVGGGQPQFMSDDRIISYLVKTGEDLEDARDWTGYG